MRRARLYLAITAYYVFIRRFIVKSFREVFYCHDIKDEAATDSLPVTFSIIRISIYAYNYNPCNPGLITGFFTRNLRI